MTQSINKPIFEQSNCRVYIKKDPDFNHLYWLKVDGPNPMDILIENPLVYIALSNGSLLKFDEENPKELKVIESSDDFIEKSTNGGCDALVFKPNSISWIVCGDRN